MGKLYCLFIRIPNREELGPVNTNPIGSVSLKDDAIFPTSRAHRISVNRP